MFKRNLVIWMKTKKQGYEGLPRRKVCVRSAHHLFKFKWEIAGIEDNEDDNPP